MRQLKKGTTNFTQYVVLRDSTAGTPETAYAITSLDLQYTRNQAAPAAKVDATALATTSTAHTDNYAIEIDATSSPGLYRVDWPDAAFATGADKVILVVSGTGLDPCVEEIQLVNYDPEDAVRMGMTALPNAAADAAGGLPISDAGGLDLDAQIGTKINDILTDTGTTLQGELDGIQADTEDIQTQIGTAGAGLTGVPWNASWDTEVQSECTDALNAYDPPTKAETDAAALAAFTTQMTEAYAANGVAPTPAQALFAIHQYLMQFGIATTNYTVKKLDNSTTAFVVTLNDATTPTGATRT